MTYVVPGSHLERLLATCTPLNPLERAAVLEGDELLESEYHTVALQGDSDVPDNPEDEVDFHYVCFVKSHRNHHLYLLDGDRKGGPIDLGHLGENSDALSNEVLERVREFIGKCALGVGFSLLALAPE
jgi:ubiquitin carboxyl-terminal hydrolase L3